MSFATQVPKDFLLATFIGLNNIRCAWMPYIKEGDTTYAALRRAAISIWVCSLIEFIDKKADRKAAIAEIDKTETCPQLVVRRISELEADAVEILSCFSGEEQVALWYLRNQSVHGHLSLYFHDDLRVSLFEASSGRVEKKSFSRAHIDAANQALTGFKPMQRFSSFDASNALLNLNLEALSSTAIEEYHIALFGRPFS